MIGHDSTLKQQLLQLHHDSAMEGHGGIIATLHRLNHVYHWKEIKKDVHKYVQKCEVCQNNKVEIVATPGLLQHLPIPE